jgi:endonuclease YncB( thermonuclease family)
MQQYLKIALIFLIFASCVNRNNPLKKSDTITGKVVSVIDGDTYDLLLKGNRKIRVRMEGIDAPERGMPFYKVSKNHLAQLCFNKNVSLNITGIDGHDRFLGFTYLDDGSELSHEMIKAGLAWHFKKYNSDSILSNLEIEAKKMKRGLWLNENPMAPWTNRSLHRQGISTKDSFNIVQ